MDSEPLLTLKTVIFRQNFILLPLAELENLASFETNLFLFLSLHNFLKVIICLKCVRISEKFFLEKNKLMNTKILILEKLQKKMAEDGVNGGSAAISIQFLFVHH